MRKQGLQVGSRPGHCGCDYRPSRDKRRTHTHGHTITMAAGVAPRVLQLTWCATNVSGRLRLTCRESLFQPMSIFAPAALESANVQITSLWVPSQFPVHSAIWTEYPPWNLQRCLYVSLCFFLRVKANSVWPPVTVEKLRAWTFYTLLRYYVMPFPLRFQTSEVVFPDKSFGGVFLHCQVFSIQNAACKLFEEMKGAWIQTILLLSAVPSFYNTFWKSKQFQPACRLAWNSWERSLNMLHLQWSWHWSLRASHCKCWRRRLWAEYLDQTHVGYWVSYCAVTLCRKFQQLLHSSSPRCRAFDDNVEWGVFAGDCRIEPGDFKSNAVMIPS